MRALICLALVGCSFDPAILIPPVIYPKVIDCADSCPAMHGRSEITVCLDKPINDPCRNPAQKCFCTELKQRPSAIY